MIAQSRTSRRIFGAGVAASALALAFPAGMASAQARDIVDTAVAAGQFTTLARALQPAGLVDTLKGPGPFTVFAPTDAAFAKAAPGPAQRLLADPAQLRRRAHLPRGAGAGHGGGRGAPADGPHRPGRERAHQRRRGHGADQRPTVTRLTWPPATA